MWNLLGGGGGGEGGGGGGSVGAYRARMIGVWEFETTGENSQKALFYFLECISTFQHFVCLYLNYMNICGFG